MNFPFQKKRLYSMSSKSSEKKDDVHKLTAKMEATTLGEKRILSALQLIDKALKREKTVELLLMRARVHEKTKRY